MCIRYSRLVLVGILSFSLLKTATCQDFSFDSWNQLDQELNDCKYLRVFMLGTHESQISRYKKSGVLTAIVTENGKQKNYVRIWNRFYYADLDQEANGDWMITKLVKASEKTAEDDIDQPTGGNFLLFLKPQIYKFLKSNKPIDDSVSQSGALKTLRWENPNDSIREYTIVVDRSINWLPRKFTQLYNDGSKYISEYSYSTNGDKIQWVETNNRLEDKNGKLEREPWRDYVERDWKPDHSSKACYLTHYGLPEPKWAKKSSFWFYASLAFFFTAVCAVTFIWIVKKSE